MVKEGLAGLQEALDYINKERETNALKITTCVFDKSAYYHKNLELKISVQSGTTTEHFHIGWENPFKEDNDYEEYFPIEGKALNNSSKDIFDLFMNIKEEISPDTHVMIMYLFDEVCHAESKEFKLMVSEDNGIQFIRKLEGDETPETNENGVLPFDYVSRYNELEAHLEELTEYPPEEVTEIDTFVAKMRDLNASKTILVDIDYNIDATLVIIQAEDKKSFSVNVNLIPELDVDDDEMNVASYYLLAMFHTAVADKEKYTDITDKEIRQIDRMVLEFQTNSAAEEVAKSSTSTTVVKTVNTTAAPGSTFRAATYDGVSKSADTGIVSGKKVKGNKRRSRKSGSKNAFPDFNGGIDSEQPDDYSRQAGLFLGDDAYPYE